MEVVSLMGKSDYPMHSVTVCGKEWVVLWVPTRAFNKKYGKSTMAITHMDEKRIFLRVKAASFETIAHELMHAALWEMGLAVAELNPEQLEELFCECFSKYGESISAAGRYLEHQGRLLRGNL